MARWSRSRRNTGHEQRKTIITSRTLEKRLRSISVCERERARNQTQYQFESINLAAAASHLIFKSMFIIIIIGTPEKTSSGIPNQSYRTIQIPSTQFPALHSAHILLVLHRSWAIKSYPVQCAFAGMEHFLWMIFGLCVANEV